MPVHHALVERIAQTILFIRGEKVLLDEDLAVLYGVETRAVVQAVKRNGERFPDDFMFQLTREELANLRSQSVISSSEGHGGRRFAPYAFTQEGVAMLSSVLRSDQAVQVNIEIMRALSAFGPSFLPIMSWPRNWRTLRGRMIPSSRRSSTLSDSSWRRPSPRKSP